jgi:hypothetical protein
MVTCKSPKTVLNHVLTDGNWLKQARIESRPLSNVTSHHSARWINDPVRD